ncbi:MAG: hypothetical protein ACREFL_10810 [Stellaceae bacterium]
MADSTRAAYDGPIALGMVFDFEPGKRHLYERLTISKIEGSHIWARGRSGETYYDERDFRSGVVFIADKQQPKTRAAPAPLVKPYDGPIAVGMVFDFEPGKKHLYERLTVWKTEGEHLYAFGRSGMTYYEEADFRQSVVPVPPDEA